MPAFPPPEPFEEPRHGRFGKKGRKSEAPPAAVPTPSATAPPPVQAAVPDKPKKDKSKKEKKGLFAPLKNSPKAAAPPPPPPPIPPQPVTPPKPRFAAPFNYTPPNASPPVTKPPTTYPTASSPAQPHRPWGPPASFNPPPSPSFSSWGPDKPAFQSVPAPEPQTEPAAAPGKPFDPPAPGLVNGNGGYHGRAAQDAGPWSFGINSAEGNAPTGGPTQDPVLPAFIELSMFQDPTSADDISAEHESGEDYEQVPQDSGAEEAWLAEDAWPAANESRHRREQDPRPMDRLPAEETQLLEQHWPQQTPEPEVGTGPDWTSADTPWPGETRRPAEPTWADEAPAAELSPAGGDRETPAAELPPEPPRWGDEPWQHEVRQPEPQPRQWAREPETSRRFGNAPDQPAEDAWGRELPRERAERPGMDPWEAAQPAAEYPDDPWVQARQAATPPGPPVREVEPVRTPVAPPPTQERSAPVRDSEPAEPASNGRQLFIDDDDDDWKPMSFDMNLDEPQAPADPVAEAAARLKAAETAIKVDNGLAYVLVDDEGRAVLK